MRDRLVANAREFHALSGARPSRRTWTQYLMHSYDFVRTGARRQEYQIPPGGRTDSNDPVWLITFAKEQLALITDDTPHGISFGYWFVLAEGVGNAPTSVDTDPVFRTGAASLYLPAFQNGARGRIHTLIFDVRTIALYGLSYASKGFTRTHRKLFPAITSTVRGLCRRPVSIWVKLAAQAGIAPTHSG